MTSNCFTVSFSSTASVAESSSSSEIPWNNFFHWKWTLPSALLGDQYRFGSLFYCTYERISHTPQETFPVRVSLQLRIVIFSTSHKVPVVTFWESAPAGKGGELYIKKHATSNVHSSRKNGECALVMAKLPWADQMVVVVCPQWKISETEQDPWDQIRKEQRRMDSTCNKLYHKTQNEIQPWDELMFSM